jgi:glycosyltransferase involved in cell wall biosynthesis
MANELTEVRPHAAFVMEQHVGHRTFFQNLRTFVDQDSRINATWVPVTYRPGSTQWTWHRLLPEHLRGTLDGRTQVQEALRHRYDVVFFNTQVPAVLGGSIARHAPYIVSTDITPIQYDAMATLYNHHPDKPGPMQWLKHRANVETLRKAARILPWTQWVSDSIVKDYGVSPERITVVPAGVDTRFWTLKPGFNRGKRFRILFVGGDFARKGGELLLQVFHSLPANLAELHIVTQSDVPNGENIHVYRNMQPNTPELLTLYHHSDAFILPTGADAFGFVLVEAMACGLPVITTHVGGVAEVVTDGETGFLVQPDDVFSFRARLLQLAGNEQLVRQMGTAAHKRVEIHFNAQIRAEEIVTHLCQVAGAQRTRQGGAR